MEARPPVYSSLLILPSPDSSGACGLRRRQCLGVAYRLREVYKNTAVRRRATEKSMPMPSAGARMTDDGNDQVAEVGRTDTVGLPAARRGRGREQVLCLEVNKFLKFRRVTLKPAKFDGPRV